MQATETPIDHPLHGDEHPERHEHSDINIGPLMAVLAVGILVVVATLFGVYWLFYAYGTIDRYFLDKGPMTAIQTPRIQPREPRVQGIPGFHTNLPWQDTAEMKSETASELAGYGDIGEAGFVHIPIKQAMQQLASDGSLKVRKDPNVPNQGGADVAP